MKFVVFSILFSLSCPLMAKVKADCSVFKFKKSATASLQLKNLMQAYWESLMEEVPEFATYSGYPGQDHRWIDLSKAARQNRQKISNCQLNALAQIPKTKLSASDRLNYVLLEKKIKENIEGYNYPQESLAVINQLEGIHFSLADMMADMPKQSKKDFENRLSRLEKFPKLAEQAEDLLREGLDKKVTPVKFLIEKVPDQIQNLMTMDVKESPIYRGFVVLPDFYSADEKKLVQLKAQTLIKEKVYPALLGLKEFLVNEYIPKARTSVAMSELPNGKSWYAYLNRLHTTTNLSSEKIHQLGLQEVARIDREMEKIRQQVKFKGDKAAFNQFLNSDPQFFHNSAKELLDNYLAIAKKIDPEVPRLFGRLPRLPYGIREMAAYKAPMAPTAYYQGGSLKSGRAGYFEANTYDLKSRPKWEMEVLTVHEAVPGHHLQIAIAQEMDSLPEFRKNEGYNAFVEGWGLYSEDLGDELGLYKDPYSKYGQLTFDMWRAVRLVVDTGMHSLGWSKEKALSYFMEHVPKTRLQAENEIDRYITWPGQALSYKIGQLKFFELRDRAQKKLGDKFNIRDFHDEILRNGSLPMDILEVQFNQWLAKASSAKTNLNPKN